jgi:hypothetical protein
VRSVVCHAIPVRFFYSSSHACRMRFALLCYSEKRNPAFPERMLALMVTLIFEIPVLVMISGGSDALCQLVGRSKYQLLIGFLPLTSAISG